jgi:hypothetical protein
MTGSGAIGMSGAGIPGGGLGGMSSLSSANRPVYGAPRFEGTGFAGAKSTASPAASTTSLVSREQDTASRPSLGRQDTAPPGLESKTYGGRNDYSNGNGSARAAQPQLQATRPAPPRPQQSRDRERDQQLSKLSPPKLSNTNATQQRVAGARDRERDPRELTPTKSREDGQPQRGVSEREPLPVRKESINERPLPQPTAQQQQQRQRDRERERERERDRERDRERAREQQTLEAQRPQLVPAKSMPATSNPATEPVTGPAGALVGPPPVKPLQTAKKLPPAGEKEAAVSAAAAALEKPMPKQVEKRFSAMTEAQIMEKLRSVVNQDDPRTLYTTIKKIGQG